MPKKTKTRARQVASLERLAADRAATPAEKTAAQGRVAAITKRAKPKTPKPKPSAMTADLQEDFVSLLTALHEGAAGNRIDGLTISDRAEYLLIRAAGLDPGPRVAMPGALLTAHLDDAHREKARLYFENRHRRFQGRLDERLHLDPVSQWAPSGAMRGERAMEQAFALHGEALQKYYPDFVFGKWGVARGPISVVSKEAAKRSLPQVESRWATRLGQALPPDDHKALPAPAVAAEAR